MLFDVARLTANADRIDRLHGPVELEIKRASDEIRHAEQMESEEYADHVAETNRELIEELLGVALVSAQVFLTSVRNRFIALAPAYREDFKDELALDGKPVSKDMVFTCGEKLSSKVAFTDIEAINALANYWKHHDEWPKGWKEDGEWCVAVWSDQASKLQKKTIEVVTVLGMAPARVWNLQKAVEALGVEEYHELAPVREKLAAWADSLLNKAAAQIRKASPQFGAALARRVVSPYFFAGSGKRTPRDTSAGDVVR
jgi:hypothetical protein